MYDKTTADVSFGRTGIPTNGTFIVDESFLTGYLNPNAGGETMNVEIKEGKTFTVSARIVGAGGKVANIYGDGTYIVNMSDNANGTTTPLFLRANTVFKSSAFLNSGSKVTVGGGKTLSTEIASLRLKGNAKLTIGEVDEQGNVVSTGNLAIYTKAAYADNNNSWVLAQGTGNVLTINKGSTASMGVFQGVTELYTSDDDAGISLTVNGTMNVGFNSRSSKKPFAVWGYEVTVGNGGVINITNAETNADMFVKKSLDNAGTINIATGNYLYMSNNSTLTLREGSDIRTNGVASQKDSVIYLQHGDYHYTDGVERNGVKTTSATVANVNVVLEADQELGAFSLLDGATLTIDLNENALALGGITVQNGETFYLILDDFVNNSLSVEEGREFKLKNVQASYKTDDIDNYMYLDDLEWITENGRSYLYSASLTVPEPAEWAMIFGAIALIFVAYRKRR